MAARNSECFRLDKTPLIHSDAILHIQTYVVSEFRLFQIVAPR